MNKEDNNIDSAIRDIEKLIKSIDPQTNLAVEDSILSSKYNQKLLIYVTSLLEELKSIRNENDARKKATFYLTESNKKQFAFFSSPVSISKLTYSLNELIDNTNMKKIRATQITNYLLENGYLCIQQHQNNKIATKKGINLGISIKPINGTNHPFLICLYNENAQKFILDNINEIAKL